MASSLAYIRAHPRLMADLPVEVPASDRTLRARGVNISRAGMHLVADRVAAQIIAGGEPRLAGAGKRVECRIRAQLSLPDEESATLEADCRVVFMRRESENTYGIGMEYLRFHDDGREILERYIQWRLSQLPAQW